MSQATTPAYSDAASGKPAETDLEGLRAHLLARIAITEPRTEPFRHLYVEDVFPDRFYELLRGHMLAAKCGRRTEDRHQDSPRFTTARFNLMNCDDPVIASLRAAFSEREVMTSLAAKFFLEPGRVVEEGLIIHQEFEYTFTRADRFQTIHVDIPPKYLSFVFYIPEYPDLGDASELENATILYGDDLQPRHCARFRRNSVCIFAPHFRSYHGFASTMDRDALVMFYVQPAELDAWQRMRFAHGDEPPFSGLRELIGDKLRRHPLIEFGRDEAAIGRAREACRVNAPQGRVLNDPT